MNAIQSYNHIDQIGSCSLYDHFLREAGAYETAPNIWCIPQHVDMKAIDRKVMAAQGQGISIHV